MLSNEKPILPLDACYFLTLNTVDKIDVFVRPAYKQVIADALNHFIRIQGLHLYSWCLMTSHLHLVVRTKDGRPRPILNGISKNIPPRPFKDDRNGNGFSTGMDDESFRRIW
jgi:hypothetical protein